MNIFFISLTIWTSCQFGSATGVALGALYPVANYFMPLRAGGGGGGTSAKDELGNPITKTGWLATHQAGDWGNRRIWFKCNLYSFRLRCPMG